MPNLADSRAPRTGGEVPGSLVGELKDVRISGRRRAMVTTKETDRSQHGGIALLAAALVALVWSNSPWRASYQSVWHTGVAVSMGRFFVDGDLRHWVNNALMAVFFLVVGLEIKREMVHGSLRDPKTAAMPAIAALGGMVAPALLFVVVNAGGSGARGWGIPMATDIAFAVGVVALVGPRVPASLRLFLLTLAVVDDIGAIIVIAVFYSSDVALRYVGAAVALAAVIAVLNWRGVVRLAPYVVVGALLWLTTYASGVHATIAGVVLGLLMPVGPAASPGARLDRVLQPWSTFLVLPVFALANAGVVLSVDAFGASGAVAVTAGVVLGLVAGKTFGIAGAMWLGVRGRLGLLPQGATWPMMVAVAAIAGVGFTVSLFIAELAFDTGPLQDAARTGVLAGSAVAAVAGWAALRRACRENAVPV